MYRYCVQDFLEKKTIARIINHHRKAEAEKEKYIGKY